MEILATIKHFFLPRESNNQRAKILHPSAIIFYILFFLAVQLSINVLGNLGPNILGYATNISVNDLFTLTNQKRAENGLPLISLSPELNNAAAGKAQDMFSKNYWAHNAPDGTSPWVFITGAGYNYLYAGENLAKDFGDSVGVINAWMDSPTHRANILNDKYKDIGFAVANGTLNGSETTLVVQFFGTRAGGAPQTSQVAAATVPTATPIPLSIPTKTLPKPSPTQVPATPTPTLMPTATPTTIPVAATKTTSSTPESSGTVITKPLFDPYRLTKIVSVVLALLLLIILGIDGLLAYRRRIVRLSGHNMAHMTYLLMLLLSIYFLGRGSIL